jgi:hypothetical protein
VHRPSAATVALQEAGGGFAGVGLGIGGVTLRPGNASAAGTSAGAIAADAAAARVRERVRTAGAVWATFVATAGVGRTLAASVTLDTGCAALGIDAAAGAAGDGAAICAVVPAGVVWLLVGAGAGSGTDGRNAKYAATPITATSASAASPAGRRDLGKACASGARGAATSNDALGTSSAASRVARFDSATSGGKVSAASSTSAAIASTWARGSPSGATTFSTGGCHAPFGGADP